MSIAGSRESPHSFKLDICLSAGVFYRHRLDLRLKGLVHQDAFTDWIAFLHLFSTIFEKFKNKFCLSLVRRTRSLAILCVSYGLGVERVISSIYQHQASLKSPREFGRCGGSYSLIFKGVLGERQTHWPKSQGV